MYNKVGFYLRRTTLYLASLITPVINLKVYNSIGLYAFHVELFSPVVRVFDPVKDNPDPERAETRIRIQDPDPFLMKKFQLFHFNIQ